MDQNVSVLAAHIKTSTQRSKKIFAKPTKKISIKIELFVEFQAAF